MNLLFLCSLSEIKNSIIGKRLIYIEMTMKRSRVIKMSAVAVAVEFSHSSHTKNTRENKPSKIIP
jgi:hypothetical protein